MDINQSILDETYRSPIHILTKTDSSTMDLNISSCDLSKEHEVLNLVNQASNKSINVTSPNQLFEIKKLRIRNANKIIIGNLNIISLPNKFEQLKDIVMQHIDILVLIKTKLDDTFPAAQFLVNSFSEPYRLDRNRKGGGIMVYISEDTPSKLLDKHVFPYDMEGLFVELNFRKCKWLLFRTYHPPSQADIYYFDNLDKAFDTYSSYEKRVLIGDFNTETSEPRIDSFIYEHDLQNLENPICINLILTNNAMAFQNTTTVFTGLSDFHKLVLTVLKTSITKSKPLKIAYRYYKNFDSVRFNDELKYVLVKEKITSCTKFDEMFLQILNQHAPLKSKLLRANHASYISKHS